MAKKISALRCPTIRKAVPKIPVIGVFSAGDPRIDRASRIRCRNIVKMAADTISGSVVLPDKTPIGVVYSDILVDARYKLTSLLNSFERPVSIYSSAPPTPGHIRSQLQFLCFSNSPWILP